MMDGIFLLLGSNLGERQRNLELAKNLISKHISPILDKSSIYETKAWGIEDQQDFLNQVIKISTKLTPQNLLEKLLAIEQKMGRVRKVKWGARLIDLDILFYNNEIVKSADLEIPHPGIPDRRFTLVPLAEIAEGEEHPVTGKSITQLLNDCPDVLTVKKFLPK